MSRPCGNWLDGAVVRAVDQLIRPLDEIVRDCVEKIIAAPPPPPSVAEPPDLRWPDDTPPDQDCDETIAGAGAAWAGEALGTEFSVRAAITYLHALNKKPLWGYKKENRDAIEVVGGQIKLLRDAIAALPDAALILLFAREGEAGGDIPSPAARTGTLTRVRVATAMLRQLQARCDQIIATSPGEHGSVGFRQRLAAEQAWDLVVQHRIRPSSTSSVTSLFHQITGLLYESMTGKAGEDLARACRDVFDRKKETLVARKKISKKKLKR